MLREQFHGSKFCGWSFFPSVIRLHICTYSMDTGVLLISVDKAIWRGQRSCPFSHHMWNNQCSRAICSRIICREWSCPFSHMQCSRAVRSRIICKCSRAETSSTKTRAGQKFGHFLDLPISAISHQITTWLKRAVDTWPSCLDNEVASFKPFIFCIYQ